MTPYGSIISFCFVPFLSFFIGCSPAGGGEEKASERSPKIGFIDPDLPGEALARNQYVQFFLPKP
ncbi:MAG: hypothetical protein LBJ64_04105 [Deltaproteobacteria bacterium]|nr:hypothetical protein [Deltaproteobacteria bacterium]